MEFIAAGVFELKRKPNGHIDDSRKAKQKFWQEVSEEAPGLKDAAGCYVFVTFSNRRALPWYVGKAENQSFGKEIFAIHKLKRYNEVTVDKHGTPYIFLIPRVKANGSSFCRPTKGKNDSIKFLEILLIGMALRRNANLSNVKDTALLRKLRVKSVINSKGNGRPNNTVKHLRGALGIS